MIAASAVVNMPLRSLIASGEAIASRKPSIAFGSLIGRPREAAD